MFVRLTFTVRLPVPLCAETEAYLLLEARGSQRIDQRLQNQLNDRATDDFEETEVCASSISL